MDPIVFPALVELVGEIPEDSIVSRTLMNSDHLKVVLFGFAAGQELSEHTASMPAVLHFLQGEAQVTLAEELVNASAGTWIHMPAHMPHTVNAQSLVVMLLLLLKK